MSKEYLSDYRASRGLARKIEKYWHDLGYTNVHVWSEKFYMSDNPELSKRAGARPIYAVRSNITFADPE